MAKCTCLSDLGNTGVPNCQVAFDVTKQLILVPYFKLDGTVNGIDLAGNPTIDQAFLDGKFQANDINERWFPIPELKNVVDERAEDILETFEDGTTAFIQEGARTFTGLLVGGTSTLKGQLDKWKCETLGVFFIDKSGNLIGDNGRDGWLDPVKVQKDTLSVLLVKGTDTTKQKLQITFTVDQLMDDANLSYIGSSEISGNLLGSTGLLDAIVEKVETITTTGFVATLTTRYGSALQKQPVRGLEVGDFGLFNKTQAAAIVPTSVTEGADGVYTFVFTAAASADVLELGNKTTGDLDKGFDIKKTEITIP